MITSAVVSRALNCLRRSFPVGFRGRESTKTTPPRSFLYPAALAATIPLISCANASWLLTGTEDLGTTNALGISVASVSSQVEVTPTSCTSWCCPMSSSISVGETWNLGDEHEVSIPFQGCYGKLRCGLTVPFVFDHILDPVNDD
jgi:hypothetical protein